MVGALCIEIEQIDVENEIGVDRLRKKDSVNPPKIAVCKRHPLDAEIRGVVDSLLDVRVFQFQPDGFHLDDHLELAVDTRGEIAIRPPYAKLARDFAVLVVSENLCKNVRDNH